jgi:hypothetical protein
VTIPITRNASFMFLIIRQLAQFTLLIIVNWLLALEPITA